MGAISSFFPCIRLCSKCRIFGRSVRYWDIFFRSLFHLFLFAVDEVDVLLGELFVAFWAETVYFFVDADSGEFFGVNVEIYGEIVFCFGYAVLAACSVTFKICVFTHCFFSPCFHYFLFWWWRDGNLCLFFHHCLPRCFVL